MDQTLKQLCFVLAPEVAQLLASRSHLLQFDEDPRYSTLHGHHPLTEEFTLDLEVEVRVFR